MSHILLSRPQAGQRTTVSSNGGSSVSLAFSADSATLSRDGNTLIFAFEDGSEVQLTDFYINFTKGSMPEFEVDGTVVSGTEFFNAFGPDLVPAAGPAASAERNSRYSEHENSDLASGIDHLGGLDMSIAGGSTASETLLASLLDAGARGGDAGTGGFVPGPTPAPVADVRAVLYSGTGSAGHFVGTPVFFRDANGNLMNLSQGTAITRTAADYAIVCSFPAGWDSSWVNYEFRDGQLVFTFSAEGLNQLQNLGADEYLRGFVTVSVTKDGHTFEYNVEVVGTNDTHFNSQEYDAEYGTVSGFGKDSVGEYHQGEGHSGSYKIISSTGNDEITLNDAVIGGSHIHASGSANPAQMADDYNTILLNKGVSNNAGDTLITSTDGTLTAHEGVLAAGSTAHNSIDMGKGEVHVRNTSGNGVTAGNSGKNTIAGGKITVESIDTGVNATVGGENTLTGTDISIQATSDTGRANGVVAASNGSNVLSAAGGIVSIDAHSDSGAAVGVGTDANGVAGVTASNTITAGEVSISSSSDSAWTIGMYAANNNTKNQAENSVNTTGAAALGATGNVSVHVNWDAQNGILGSYEAHALAAYGEKAVNRITAEGNVDIKAGSSGNVVTGLIARYEGDNVVDGEKNISIAAASTAHQAAGLRVDTGGHNSLTAKGTVDISAEGTTASGMAVASLSGPGYLVGGSNTVTSDGKTTLVATAIGSAANSNAYGMVINYNTGNSGDASNTITSGDDVVINSSSASGGAYGMAVLSSGTATVNAVNTISTDGHVEIDATGKTAATAMHAAGALAANSIAAKDVTLTAKSAGEAIGLSAESKGTNKITGAGDIGITAQSTNGDATGIFAVANGSNTITGKDVDITADATGSHTARGVYTQAGESFAAKNTIEGHDVTIEAHGDEEGAYGIHAVTKGGPEAVATVKAGHDLTIKASSDEGTATGNYGNIAVHAEGNDAKIDLSSGTDGKLQVTSHLENSTQAHFNAQQGGYFSAIGLSAYNGGQVTVTGSDIDILASVGDTSTDGTASAVYAGFNGTTTVNGYDGQANKMEFSAYAPDYAITVMGTGSGKVNINGGNGTNDSIKISAEAKQGSAIAVAENVTIKGNGGSNELEVNAKLRGPVDSGNTEVYGGLKGAYGLATSLSSNVVIDGIEKISITADATGSGGAAYGMYAGTTISNAGNRITYTDGSLNATISGYADNADNAHAMYSRLGGVNSIQGGSQLGDANGDQITLNGNMTVDIRGENSVNTGDGDNTVTLNGNMQAKGSTSGSSTALNQINTGLGSDTVNVNGSMIASEKGQNTITASNGQINIKATAGALTAQNDGSHNTITGKDIDITAAAAGLLASDGGKNHVLGSGTIGNAGTVSIKGVTGVEANSGGKNDISAKGGTITIEGDRYGLQAGHPDSHNKVSIEGGDISISGNDKYGIYAFTSGKNEVSGTGGNIDISGRGGLHAVIGGSSGVSNEVSLEGSGTISISSQDYKAMSAGGNLTGSNASNTLTAKTGNVVITAGGTAMSASHGINTITSDQVTIKSGDYAMEANRDGFNTIKGKNIDITADTTALIAKDGGKNSLTADYDEGSISVTAKTGVGMSASGPQSYAGGENKISGHNIDITAQTTGLLASGSGLNLITANADNGKVSITAKAGAGISAVDKGVNEVSAKHVDITGQTDGVHASGGQNTTYYYNNKIYTDAGGDISITGKTGAGVSAADGSWNSVTSKDIGIIGYTDGVQASNGGVNQIYIDQMVPDGSISITGQTGAGVSASNGGFNTVSCPKIDATGTINIIGQNGGALASNGGNNEISVPEGTVNITAKNGYGIFASTTDPSLQSHNTVRGNKIDITAENGVGMHADGEGTRNSVEGMDASISITARGSAIESINGGKNEVHGINDGTVTIQAGSYLAHGIHAENDGSSVKVTGGAISVNGSLSAIHVNDKGKVEVSGKAIDLTSEDGRTVDNYSNGTIFVDAKEELNIHLVNATQSSAAVMTLAGTTDLRSGGDINLTVDKGIYATAGIDTTGAGKTYITAENDINIKVHAEKDPSKIGYGAVGISTGSTHGGVTALEAKQGNITLDIDSSTSGATGIVTGGSKEHGGKTEILALNGELTVNVTATGDSFNAQGISVSSYGTNKIDVNKLDMTVKMEGGSNSSGNGAKGISAYSNGFDNDVLNKITVTEDMNVLVSSAGNTSGILAQGGYYQNGVFATNDIHASNLTLKVNSTGLPYTQDIRATGIESSKTGDGNSSTGGRNIINVDEKASITVTGRDLAAGLYAANSDSANSGTVDLAAGKAVEINVTSTQDKAYGMYAASKGANSITAPAITIKAESAGTGDSYAMYAEDLSSKNTLTGTSTTANSFTLEAKSVDGDASVVKAFDGGTNIITGGTGSTDELIVSATATGNGIATGLSAEKSGTNTITGIEKVTITAQSGSDVSYGLKAASGGTNTITGKDIDITSGTRGQNGVFTNNTYGLHADGRFATNTITSKEGHVEISARYALAADNTDSSSIWPGGGANNITVENGSVKAVGDLHGSGLTASNGGTNTVTAKGSTTVDITQNSVGLVAESGGKNAITADYGKIYVHATNLGLKATGEGSSNTLSGKDITIKSTSSTMTGMYALEGGTNSISSTGGEVEIMGGYALRADGANSANSVTVVGGGSIEINSFRGGVNWNPNNTHLYYDDVSLYAYNGGSNTITASGGTDISLTGNGYGLQANKTGSNTITTDGDISMSGVTYAVYSGGAGSSNTLSAANISIDSVVYAAGGAAGGALRTTIGANTGSKNELTANGSIDITTSASTDNQLYDPHHHDIDEAISVRANGVGSENTLTAAEINVTNQVGMGLVASAGGVNILQSAAGSALTVSITATSSAAEKAIGMWADGGGSVNYITGHSQAGGPGDNITITSNGAALRTTGGGKNIISTGDGNDSVTINGNVFGEGNEINLGGGSNTLTLNGSVFAGDLTVSSVDGTYTLILQAANPQAFISQYGGWLNALGANDLILSGLETINFDGLNVSNMADFLAEFNGLLWDMQNQGATILPPELAAVIHDPAIAPAAFMADAEVHESAVVPDSQADSAQLEDADSDSSASIALASLVDSDDQDILHDLMGDEPMLYSQHNDDSMIFGDFADENVEEQGYSVEGITEVDWDSTPFFADENNSLDAVFTSTTSQPDTLEAVDAERMADLTDRDALDNFADISGENAATAAEENSPMPEQDEVSIAVAPVVTPAENTMQESVGAATRQMEIC